MVIFRSFLFVYKRVHLFTFAKVHPSPAAGHSHWVPCLTVFEADGRSSPSNHLPTGKTESQAAAYNSVEMCRDGVWRKNWPGKSYLEFLKFEDLLKKHMVLSETRAPHGPLVPIPLLLHHSPGGSSRGSSLVRKGKGHFEILWIKQLSIRIWGS